MFPAALCHLANISYRLGRSVTFDAATLQFPGDAEANRLLSATIGRPTLSRAGYSDRAGVARVYVVEWNAWR